MKTYKTENPGKENPVFQTSGSRRQTQATCPRSCQGEGPGQQMWSVSLRRELSSCEGTPGAPPASRSRGCHPADAPALRVHTCPAGGRQRCRSLPGAAALLLTQTVRLLLYAAGSAVSAWYLGVCVTPRVGVNGGGGREAWFGCPWHEGGPQRGRGRVWDRVVGITLGGPLGAASVPRGAVFKLPPPHSCLLTLYAWTASIDSCFDFLRET